jgi:HSP20 family molecular chaperone IbpA
MYVKRHASEDNYYLTVYLRNLSPEQLRVNLDRGAIVLHTLRIRQSAGADPYGGFRTRGFQRYHRRIPLPFDADAQKMSVQRQDDSVTVTIPRRQR